MRRQFERILKLRTFCLLLMAVLTVFFGYKASDLKLYDDPNKWPPKKHPNVVLNEYMQEDFGGANVVTVQLTVKEGDIFNFKTLTKIKNITDKISQIYGVVPYYLTSLSSLHVKYMKGSDNSLEMTPLMEDPPQTPAEMERLKYGVFHNPTIYGPLVSIDTKSTIIIADFRTGSSTPGTIEELPRTDPIKIYKEIQSIIEPENDENHVVRCTGSPITIGWVNSEGLSFIGLAFVFFILVVAIVLFFAFKNFQGVLFPIASGLVVCVWAFGLYSLFYGEIIRSSSAFVVPFIFIAAVSCHSVQFLKRFFDDEYFEGRTPSQAIVETSAAIYPPLALALITDTTAFLVLAYIPFENVSVLGSIALFGLLSTMVCFCLFFIPILSYFPGSPKQMKIEGGNAKPGFIEGLINKGVVVLIEEGRARWAIIAALGVIVIFSVFTLSKVSPGQDNTYAIHNYLTKSWKNNPIYLMEMNIKEKFKGIYPLNILIEAREKGGLRNPEVIKKIDDFATFLQGFPEVGGCLNLPTYVKLMHRFYHEEEDEYFVVPDEIRTIGEYLYMYSASTPGAFDSVVDYEFQRTVIAAYVDSTSHATVKKIMGAARSYARKNFNDADVTARIGAGSIAIAEAFNENITKWLFLGTLLSAFASWLVVLLLLRSPMAGIFLLIPLFLGTVIWLAIVHLIGIEINSNTTTSMAIAIGVGIDAEVYFLYRFREEFLRVRDFKKALIAGFIKIRKALIFSHLALVAGCWALIPIPLYLGYIGFGMGLIILVCFLVSFVVSPFLWSTVKPKFLIKGLEQIASE